MVGWWVMPRPVLLAGDSEFTGFENDGPLNNTRKMQDWKMTDQIPELENVRPDDCIACICVFSSPAIRSITFQVLYLTRLAIWSCIFVKLHISRLRWQSAVKTKTVIVLTRALYYCKPRKRHCVFVSIYVADVVAVESIWHWTDVKDIEILCAFLLMNSFIYALNVLPVLNIKL